MSSEVPLLTRFKITQRYDPFDDRDYGCAAKNPHGDYVLHSDAVSAIQAVRAQWAAEVERLETDNAICRDAIGHALELVEAFAASPEGDDDGSQGAARATRRRLNEALGKMVPRLMMERELSPKYGLHWKALRAERDSAQAEAKAAKAALESISEICNETRAARDLQPAMTEIRGIARATLTNPRAGETA